MSAPRPNPSRMDPEQRAVSSDGIRAFLARNGYWRLRQGRWLTGALAGLARRLALPAWGIRTTWIFLAISIAGLLGAEPAAFIGTFLVFLAIYAGLSVAMPLLPIGAVPATAPAVDAQQQGTDAAAQGSALSPEFRNFVHFMWEPLITPPPLLRTRCHGFLYSGLRFEFSRQINNGIYYAVRMPYGRLLVYEDWLVFLTDWRTHTGRVPPLAGPGAPLAYLSLFRELRRTLSIWTIAVDAYRRFTAEERDRYRELLLNPNSFVIPMSTIQAVRRGRWATQPAVIIQTRDGSEFMFSPNPALGVGPDLFRAMWGAVGDWHAKLFRLLQRAADRNRADRAQPPAPPHTAAPPTAPGSRPWPPRNAPPPPQRPQRSTSPPRWPPRSAS